MTTPTQHPNLRSDKNTLSDIPKMFYYRPGSKRSHLRKVRFILELRSSQISPCKTSKVSHASNVSQVQAHTVSLKTDDRTLAA